MVSVLTLLPAAILSNEYSPDSAATAPLRPNTLVTGAEELVTYPCALTNAVVAMLVELSAVAGVGAVGLPARAGDASGDFLAKSLVRFVTCDSVIDPPRSENCACAPAVTIPCEL